VSETYCHTIYSWNVFHVSFPVLVRHGFIYSCSIEEGQMLWHGFVFIMEWLIKFVAHSRLLDFGRLSDIPKEAWSIVVHFAINILAHLVNQGSRGFFFTQTYAHFKLYMWILKVMFYTVKKEKTKKIILTLLLSSFINHCYISHPVNQRVACVRKILWLSAEEIDSLVSS